MSARNRCKPGDLAVIIPCRKSGYIEAPEDRENIGIIVRVLDRADDPYGDGDIFWNVEATGSALITCFVSDALEDGSFSASQWERQTDATLLDDALQPLRPWARNDAKRPETAGCDT